MRSEREAIHFLKSAHVQTGRDCFVRPVDRHLRGRRSTVWKIFTSEDDYRAYTSAGHHQR